MIQNFRTYDLALKFYRRLPNIDAPVHLKDQLNRAASSIILNLAEGSGKPTKRDRTKFYAIAFGSIREVQALTDILNCNAETKEAIDHLAARVFKLVYKQ